MKKKKDTHILNYTLNIASFWKRYDHLCDASRPQFNLQKKIRSFRFQVFVTIDKN